MYQKKYKEIPFAIFFSKREEKITLHNNNNKNNIECTFQLININEPNF